MSFSVRRVSESLVAPSELTPSETLPLSWLDKFSVRAHMPTLHVFRHGVEAAKVIKEALAKALVPYYPLAGVYGGASDNGDLHVDCTGEGVWFVEASADCTLEDVNFLEPPLAITPEEILPTDRPGIETPRVMLMMQVTEFTCGGFVVGLRFNHGIADGLGAAQFINAISEHARGLANPTVKPIWNRDLIPKPPGIPLATSQVTSLPAMNLETSIIDLSLDNINQLKETFIAKMGQKCSTFDVMAAIIWQCRTRAVESQPDVDVNISFLSSVRHLLNQVIPSEGGYYGNCLSFVSVTASSDTVAKGSLLEVVELIKEARLRLPNDYAKLLEGDLSRGAPPPPTYESIILADWTRLGFTEIDYGWGVPMGIQHVSNVAFFPIATTMKAPKPKSAIRLIAQVVTKEHLSAFIDRIKSFGEIIL